jgi:hypothetical protein
MFKKKVLLLFLLLSQNFVYAGPEVKLPADQAKDETIDKSFQEAISLDIQSQKNLLRLHKDENLDPYQEQIAQFRLTDMLDAWWMGEVVQKSAAIRDALFQQVFASKTLEDQKKLLDFCTYQNFLDFLEGYKEQIAQFRLTEMLDEFWMSRLVQVSKAIRDTLFQQVVDLKNDEYKKVFLRLWAENNFPIDHQALAIEQWPLKELFSSANSVEKCSENFLNVMFKVISESKDFDLQDKYLALVIM